ncbi:MAG: excalibur calcium-binding domain-containing protein [Chloroflexi bacterium]|nr:excalibur calcium-binding domain-containing protein [Chloroflexota bacterium]
MHGLDEDNDGIACESSPSNKLLGGHSVLC